MGSFPICSGWSSCFEEIHWGEVPDTPISVQFPIVWCFNAICSMLQSLFVVGIKLIYWFGSPCFLLHIHIFRFFLPWVFPILSLSFHLVGGFEHCLFSHILECHHPNWRTHIFQRQVGEKPPGSTVFQWFSHVPMGENLWLFLISYGLKSPILPDYHRLSNRNNHRLSID